MTPKENIKLFKKSNKDKNKTETTEHAAIEFSLNNHDNFYDRATMQEDTL
jgi:hypothetical protein